MEISLDTHAPTIAVVIAIGVVAVGFVAFCLVDLARGREGALPAHVGMGDAVWAWA
jgi:hypothetical protein